MTDQNIQEQISALSQKLDLVLEYVTIQQQKREEFDDLVEDLSIVAKDAFRNTVITLDKAQVELDTCGISCLVIRVLQNLQTFHELLEMMESARDFMKDASPILHQIGLDAVHKMNELDQKGYFEYLKELGRLADAWVENFTPGDVARLRESLPQLAGTLRNLTDPALLKGISHLTETLKTVQPDDRLDDRSLWKILMDLRSPEVRKTLSYSLRFVKALNH